MIIVKLLFLYKITPLSEYLSPAIKFPLKQHYWEAFNAKTIMVAQKPSYSMLFYNARSTYFKDLENLKGLTFPDRQQCLGATCMLCWLGCLFVFFFGGGDWTRLLNEIYSKMVSTSY